MTAQRLQDLAAQASGTDPIEALRAAHELRPLARELVLQRAAEAHAAGVSWNEIGSAVGLSDRAAWKALRPRTSAVGRAVVSFKLWLCRNAYPWESDHVPKLQR